MKLKMGRIAAAIAIAIAGVGCGSMEDVRAKYDVQRQAVQSFEVTTAKLQGDAAYGAITSIFVERGFDIKVANKEGGVVTTEHKKFASVGGNPPFDYYLQIRATIRTIAGGKTVIRLTPLVKEQNRSNAAAFTERELQYYEGSPEAVRMVDRGGWMTSGQTFFNNVVSDIATRGGTTMGDVTKNVTTTKYNTLLKQ